MPSFTAHVDTTALGVADLQDVCLCSPATMQSVLSARKSHGFLTAAGCRNIFHKEIMLSSSHTLFLLFAGMTYK